MYLWDKKKRQEIDYPLCAMFKDCCVTDEKQTSGSSLFLLGQAAFLGLRTAIKPVGPPYNNAKDHTEMTSEGQCSDDGPNTPLKLGAKYCGMSYFISENKGYF